MDPYEEIQHRQSNCTAPFPSSTRQNAHRAILLKQFGREMILLNGFTYFNIKGSRTEQERNKIFYTEK